MIVTTIPQLHDALKLVKDSPRLVLDIETTGLNPRKDKVIGIGLSNGESSVYLPHLAWDGEKLQEILTFKDCRVVLESMLANHTQLICHNASFDLRFIRCFFNIDLVPNLWSDSMLAKHTCDEDFPFGLKEIAANLFGEDAKSEQNELKKSIKDNGGTVNEMFKADLSVLAKYCIQDCILTWKVNEHYVCELENQGLTKFFFEDEVMPLYKYVTIPMESAGVPVDVPLLQKTKVELDAAIVHIEAQIQEMIRPHSHDFISWFLNKEYPPTKSGVFAQAMAEILRTPLPRTATGKLSFAASHIDALPNGLLFKKWYTTDLKLSEDLIRRAQVHLHGDLPKVNLSSKHHLKKIFFDTLKEEPLSRTQTGLPQVDETFLESIKHKYDFVPLLLDFNKLMKIKGTYVDRLLEDQENGVWYPSFQQHRTISGRMGSDAQQLPRKLESDQGSDIVLKYNNLIRDFIISAPDSVLIGADYESLEPKVFSHMSGDENLKDIFRQGKDFYSEVALRTEKLKGVSSDKSADNYLGKVNKVARQTAKAYALGIPYGLTGYKLQFEINVDQKTADRLVQDYLDAFPALHAFMNESRKEAKHNGFVRSEAGRVRHLKKAKELYCKYGDDLLDSLALWKEYHEDPRAYGYMKELRKTYNNLLNNSINFKIQSLAASIVNRAMIAINQEFARKGLKALIILTIHDEIVVHCPLAEATEVCYIMKRGLEETYKISVPLLADPVIATVYGETK